MTVYEPREDSFLLQKYVRKYAKGTVLDMGTGSGIQALAAARKRSVKNVLAVDKSKAAITSCQRQSRHPKITYRRSDLFSQITGMFDTIIFNPPYLPTQQNARDMALDGGKKGYEVLEQFINQASKHLRQNGILLILFSSLTNKGMIDQFLLENLFLHQELVKQHIFFEDLYVYKVWKHPAVQTLEKQRIRNIVFFTKGKRGMIWTGAWKGKKVAIKLQLPGISVKSIGHEYTMLKLLNTHDIGPRVFWSKGNMMVYAFVEGSFFPEFIMTASRKLIQELIIDVMQQCRKLDQLGLTKQEMHHPIKHIVVTRGNKAVLLDFERCRKTKKQKNVTQFCQYLTLPYMQRLLNRKGLDIGLGSIRTATQQYKRHPSKESFEETVRIVTGKYTNVK